MTDLTKITTPYGLLDEDTQEALDRARKDGKPIQVVQDRGWEMREGGGPFCRYLTYRVKPEPVTVTNRARMLRYEGEWGVYVSCGNGRTGTLTTTLDEDGHPVRAVWEADND